MPNSSRLMIVLILVLSLIALIVPMYPQPVTKPATAQYSYTVMSQTYSLRQIFSLLLPIRVNPSQSGLTLGVVTLVEGSLATIQTTGCQACMFEVVEHWNPKVHVLSLLGEGNVTFIAPGTGQYDILATNLTSTPQTIKQLAINTNTPNTSQFTTNGNYTYMSIAVQNAPSILANPIAGIILAAITIISILLLLRTIPQPRRRR